MSEVRNGDQKVQKYLFSEIFYCRREVYNFMSRNIFVLLLILMVGSRSIQKSYGPTERGIVT